MDEQQVERYHRKQTTTRTARRRLARETAIVRGLLADLAPSSLILDAPCGVGPNTRSLQAAGYRVIALDLNPFMLRHAVRDAAPAHTVRADAFALPLADRSVDAVVVVRLLHYLATADERRALLAEARRVARRRVVVSFMHRIAVAPLLKARPTRKTTDVTTLRADAAAVGLRVTRVRPVLPFVKRMWFVALEPIEPDQGLVP